VGDEYRLALGGGAAAAAAAAGAAQKKLSVSERLAAFQRTLAAAKQAGATAPQAPQAHNYSGQVIADAESAAARGGGAVPLHAAAVRFKTHTDDLFK
jgi:hypothetical protein